MTSENALLAQSKAASEAADDATFRSHLTSHVGVAYRLAMVILANPAEAEEATQDALERAWRARSSLRDADRFEAWFQRIVVNVCRDRVRRKRARPLLLSLSHREDASTHRSSPDPFEGTAARDSVRRAFAVLDVDQRAAIAMRYYLDLEVDEIARRLGTRSGTVKSRLHRALRKLRTAWENEHE